jgi:hypothetical protein
MKFRSLSLVFLVLFFSARNSYSGDWGVEGKVARLEPTFSDHLNLRIDVTAGTCPAGSWLFFYGAGSTSQEKKESVKAVYSGLLASMYAKKSVAFYGLNQGCVIEQVHLLDR